MAINAYGREQYLKRIAKYAESALVGNQAFLGVKGVGKTTLFQAYFTREKKAELATKYKKLFVFSRLDARKQGTDLYRFLQDPLNCNGSSDNRDICFYQARSIFQPNSYLSLPYLEQ